MQPADPVQTKRFRARHNDQSHVGRETSFAGESGGGRGAPDELADIGNGEYRDRSERFLTYDKAVKLGCTFLEKGDVLVARMPDPLGRACTFPGDSKKSVTVVDVAIIRPHNGEFDAKWLMFFINAPAFRRAVASMESGSTRKRISRNNLGKIALPVPPLPQQKLIVSEIEKQFSRLDEAVAGLKRVKANIKRYKAAVLKAAVEGKLTEEWRKRNQNIEHADKLLKRILAERREKWEEKNPGKKYKEPTPPDTSNLPELPEGWVWATLLQIFQTVTDGDHLPPPQTKSGVPFLVIGNVRTGKLDFADTRHVSQEYYAQIREERIPRKGDILYTLVGSYGIALFVDTAREFCIQRHIAILKPTRSLDIHYLKHGLNTAFVYRQAVDIATGTAQKTVPLAGLREIAVPFPPLQEQQKIVEEVESYLSVTEEIEQVVNTNLKRAERLRQSILKKAFSGHLTPKSADHYAADFTEFPMAAEQPTPYGSGK